MTTPPVQPGWTCPHCGLRQEDFRIRCYGCGYLRQPPQSTRGNKAVIWIGFSIMLLAGMGFFGSCVVTMGAPGAMAGARSPAIQSGETGMILSSVIGVIGVVVAGIGFVLKKQP